MSSHDAVHQRRHDILRPLVMAEAAKFKFADIDIAFDGAADHADHSIITYTSSTGAQVIGAGVKHGGPYTIDGTRFDDLQALVDAFVLTILRLHFDIFDKDLGGFGHITITPATGRVSLARNTRITTFRHGREDV